MNKTVVFSLSAEISSRFNRQRVTRMRHAIPLEDSGYTIENLELSPESMIDSRQFENFCSFYSEGEEIVLELNIRGRNISIPVVGFIYLPGAGSVTIFNDSPTQTVEARLFYA